MENETTEQLITENVNDMVNRTYEAITRYIIKYDGEELIAKLNKEINKVLGAITVVEFTCLDDIKRELSDLHERLLALREKELNKIYSK